MNDHPTIVSISYGEGHDGVLSISSQELEAPIWSRLKLAVRSRGFDCRISGGTLRLSWTDVLSIVREYGSRDFQRSLNFRFQPQGEATQKLGNFAKQIQKVRSQRGHLSGVASEGEISDRLIEKGFTRRTLKEFQLRDLIHLNALENGANFSVPGAGKTTVTFALHTLLRARENHLIVVAPKSATQVWKDIVFECMENGAANDGDEPFTVLDGNEEDTFRDLNSGSTRFIISYDLMIPPTKNFNRSYRHNTNSLGPRRVSSDESGVAVATRCISSQNRSATCSTRHFDRNTDATVRVGY